MTNYYELKISINPNLEEIVSDIFFNNSIVTRKKLKHKRI